VIGQLIDMKAVEKVEAHIADAQKKGAKVVNGGKRAAPGAPSELTVLTDVTTDMVTLREKPWPGRAALPRQDRRRAALPRQDRRRGPVLDPPVRRCA
jgi:succinate-semialdehyde dehydrogenase/glutarate-semialdehyde dehydrogenase